MPRPDFDDDRDDWQECYEHDDPRRNLDQAARDEFLPRTSAKLEEHRGTLILVLGLCGLFVCFLCAPAAWIMGSQDLLKMRIGDMDRSGYRLTRAGYVLGIIGTLLIPLVIWLIVSWLEAGGLGANPN